MNLQYHIATNVSLNKNAYTISGNPRSQSSNKPCPDDRRFFNRPFMSFSLYLLLQIQAYSVLDHFCHFFHVFKTIRRHAIIDFSVTKHRAIKYGT